MHKHIEIDIARLVLISGMRQDVVKEWSVSTERWFGMRSIIAHSAKDTKNEKKDA